MTNHEEKKLLHKAATNQRQMEEEGACSCSSAEREFSEEDSMILFEFEYTIFEPTQYSDFGTEFGFLLTIYKVVLNYL